MNFHVHNRLLLCALSLGRFPWLVSLTGHKTSILSDGQILITFLNGLLFIFISYYKMNHIMNHIFLCKNTTQNINERKTLSAVGNDVGLQNYELKTQVVINCNYLYPC